MNSKLQESKVKQLFAQQEVITNTDILYLYREKEPEIPEATVNWRIYHLVQKGVIQRIPRIVGEDYKGWKICRERISLY